MSLHIQYSCQTGSLGESGGPSGFFRLNVRLRHRACSESDNRCGSPPGLPRRRGRRRSLSSSRRLTLTGPLAINPLYELTYRRRHPILSDEFVRGRTDSTETVKQTPHAEIPPLSLNGGPKKCRTSAPRCLIASSRSSGFLLRGPSSADQQDSGPGRPRTRRAKQTEAGRADPSSPGPARREQRRG